MYPDENVTATRPPGMNLRDEDDVRPALVEHPLRPLEALARLLPREPALHRALSDERAEPVRDVVADHRSERTEQDDEPEVQIARRREVAGDDDHGLARDDGEERVHHRDPEDQRVAPPGAGHPVRDLVEVEPARHRSILRRSRRCERSFSIATIPEAHGLARAVAATTRWPARRGEAMISRCRCSRSRGCACSTSRRRSPARTAPRSSPRSARTS